MRDTARLILSLFFLLLVVIVIIFAVANRQDVAFSLAPLPYEVEMPLFFVGLIGAVIGVLLIGPSAAWRRWRLTRRVKKHEAEITRLEAELREMTAARDRYREKAGETTKQIDDAQRVGGPGEDAVKPLLPSETSDR